MTTLAQTKAIHTLRRQIAGFEEADYRGLLRQEFRVASSRDLDEREANRLIDTLRGLGGDPVRRAAQTASGPYSKVLQALWIAAYNLGLAREKDDRAMLKFVERQTGVSHTRFLVDAADARKAIEGLKAWIARAAQVEWPKNRDPLARKRAVVDAQAAIIRQTLPTFDPEVFGLLEGLPRTLDRYGERHFDRLSEKLGRMIRNRKGRS